MIELATAPTSSNQLERHPLDMATAEEFLAGREILVREGLLTESTRFAYFGLEEPLKSVVQDYEPGKPFDRSLRAYLIDQATGKSTDVVVSLTSGTVTSTYVLDPKVDGQFPIYDQEFAFADQIVHEDPEWQAAMQKRGLTDLTKVRACPLTAGSFGDEEGRRMVRVVAFLQNDPGDLAWAHPIDGVAAFVDLIEKRVVKVVDALDLPIPEETGNYDDPAFTGPMRETLKPIEVIQPEGVSFTLKGTVLEWEKWSIRVGFDAREGLSLHQISFDGRPIVYRASIPEMVVPYGDPQPTRYFQTYFDAGEYLVGKFSNSLELGCDCLGVITYLDAIVTDDRGNPRTIKNAICIHEEDYGILWKHTDMFSGSAQTRRNRRLVVSFFATVGNYDYGFYWHFMLDGAIEFEMKSTGIIFTSAYQGDGYPHATEVAPGLAAPAHQHLFSARLDMAVDGDTNAVDEIDVAGCPVGPDNQHGIGVMQQITRLRTEKEGARLAAADKGRVWRVSNPNKLNRLGRPVAYTLVPHAMPTLLADPSSSLYSRAGFATKHLWVTRYAHAERYTAGDYINQHPGGGGVPAYASAGRDIDGADIVLWHVFGTTHFPRVEDWPVMPVDRCGFMLKPTGFFDRNPTLDVPPPPKKCHSNGSNGCCGGS